MVPLLISAGTAGALEHQEGFGRDVLFLKGLKGESNTCDSYSISVMQYLFSSLFWALILSPVVADSPPAVCLLASASRMVPRPASSRMLSFPLPGESALSLEEVQWVLLSATLMEEVPQHCK